jgi:hypothetical protein
MKFVKDLSGNYPDCIVTYFNFEEYLENHPDDVALFLGYNARLHDKIHRSVKEECSSLMFFNGEQPCAYHQWDEVPDYTEFKYHQPNSGYLSSDRYDMFTDIYTICPYTAKWNNELYCGGEEKFKPILFPIDRKNLIPSDHKKWDTVFYGSVCGREHAEAIDIISKFKYRFMTLGPQYWRPNEKLDNPERLLPLCTDINIHTFEKWKILSETKVVPLYNYLFPHDNHIKNIKKYDNWELNEAWSHLDQKIVPQLKPRVTEAALFKMLMLVKRDPWNVIEHWFEPDKDFLYFDSNDELEDLIRETTTNIDKYQHIVESAYKKAYENYTTEPLLDMMVKNRRKQ